MPEEIYPEIYRIEVPLPRNPLRAINAYVIRGTDRHLLVDTGMNRLDCLEVLRRALDALAVDLTRTDIFITHGHSDHIGLVSALTTPASRIFVHPDEATHALDPALWTGLAAAARVHGFPDPEAATAVHPGRKYLFSGRPHFTPVQEGDVLPIGQYTFRCVATPGHSPGHLCLYEADAKLCFSGDHLLDTITPNISGWDDETDSLGAFFASLDKLAALDITLVLPGHRHPIRDHCRRVAELKAHHNGRLQEILGILGPEGKTAYQVAARMTWDIDCARWEDFPIPQQWFATGEALAHLRHMERAGQITERRREGTAYFTR